MYVLKWLASAPFGSATWQLPTKFEYPKVVTSPARKQRPQFSDKN